MNIIKTLFRGICRYFERVVASNSILTTHTGTLTRTVEAPIPTRYLLAKNGSGAGAAGICGATSRPIGVFTDTAPADDICPIALLGSASTTLLMVPAVTIAIGDVLYTAADGKVTNVSAAGAYAVGIALTTGAANSQVEVDPLLAVTAQS